MGSGFCSDGWTYSFFDTRYTVAGKESRGSFLLRNRHRFLVFVMFVQMEARRWIESFCYCRYRSSIHYLDDILWTQHVYVIASTPRPEHSPHLRHLRPVSSNPPSLQYLCSRQVQARQELPKLSQNPLQARPQTFLHFLHFCNPLAFRFRFC